MIEVSKHEKHFFQFEGDQTVSTAAQLIGKLPNGWTLNSLSYVGSAWHATVSGPREVTQYDR